jgi:hypothetical protein
LEFIEVIEWLVIKVDSLEFITKERLFTSHEMIAERLTALVVNMRTAQILLGEGSEKQIAGDAVVDVVEQWRQEIGRIRFAVEKIGGLMEKDTKK